MNNEHKPNLRITIRQLKYIVAVHDCKGFRKAADACFVTGPSLQEQVQKAESIVGFRIFDRDRRYRGVTVKGSALVRLARELLGLAYDIESIQPER